MNYLLCSNPECDYSTLNDFSDKVKHCLRCGSELWAACPHCVEPPYFLEKKQQFCEQCGKRIKPEANAKGTAPSRKKKR